MVFNSRNVARTPQKLPMLRRHKRTEKEGKKGQTHHSLNVNGLRLSQAMTLPSSPLKTMFVSTSQPLRPPPLVPPPCLFLCCIQGPWGKEGVEDPRLPHHAHRGRAQD